VVVLWRRRWFRWTLAAAAVCLLAWSVSSLVTGHGATVSADRGTIVA
jgi:hypothetical protein